MFFTWYSTFFLVLSITCCLLLGGCCNCVNHSNSHIIGSDLSTCTSCTTHVNCLNIKTTCGGSDGAKQVSIIPGISSNGSVVTDMQEIVISYNNTQISGIQGSNGACVILAAPGANKTIVLYEAAFQITTSGTNTTQGFQRSLNVITPAFNCNNTNINPNATAALIPANVLQNAMRNGQCRTTYQRDTPTDGRIYSTNQCVYFGWSGANAYPSGLPSQWTCLKARIRYKIYCDTAF